MKTTLPIILILSVAFLFSVAGCDDESKSNTNNVNNLNNLNNVNNVNNAVCGNGILETGEACDTDVFPDGADCIALGFTGGTISCAADCTLDTTTCEGCVDACILDESHCNIDGNAYDYCDLDAESGCTAWFTASCPEAFPMCEEPMGYANCYPTECVDECGYGEAMCSFDGAGIDTCDYLENGCTTWFTAPCAIETPECQEGIPPMCVETAVCIDECTLDEFFCSWDATGLDTCVEGPDGCTIFETTPCPVETPTCEYDAGGVASCTSTVCIDVCVLDEVQCNLAADGIDTCVTGADGCTEWSSAACPFNKPNCLIFQGNPTCRN
ncbi:hypothetical protein KJ612_19055 [Myxococcota bacterium]|nr:hypothetical protein [Myxococcota bacterium]MBU1413328.1 hypothetical protein [Myxococcota bacterium]